MIPFFFGFFVVIFVFGIDIEAIILIYIRPTLQMIEFLSEVERKQTVEFILPCFSQKSEIEIIGLNTFFFLRVIVHFSDEHMNMRIPFKIAAEGVNGGDGPEVPHLIRIEIMESIEGVLNRLSQTESFAFFAIKKITVEYNSHGISGCDEKEIKGRTVFTEQFPIRLRDGEYNMTVGNIYRHGSGFLSENLLLFYTTGVAETAVTFVKENIPVAALRAFKVIVAKINSIAEKSLFNILKHAGTDFTFYIKVVDPAIVIPENIFDAWLIRIISAMVSVKST